jgi:hypothetical protein
VVAAAGAAIVVVAEAAGNSLEHFGT